MTNTRRLMMSDGGSDLPSGYTRLEYIEGQGAIVTDYIPQSNSRIDLDYQQIENGYYKRIENDPSNLHPQYDYRMYYILYFGDKYVYENYSASGSQIKFYKSSGEISLGSPNTQRHVFTYSPESTSMDNIYYSIGTYNKPLTLLAFYGDGISGFSKSRIYECKIYEGNTIACHYIPAENIDQKQGLFDIVNNKFYVYKQLNSITSTYNTECHWNDFLGENMCTTTRTFSFKYPFPYDTTIKCTISYEVDGSVSSNDRTIDIKSGDSSFGISYSFGGYVSLRGLPKEDDYYYYDIF